LLLERYGIEAHTYCLMGNHYHLAVCTPLGNLSEGIKWLGHRYCGLTRAELGEKVGDMDYSSGSAGIRRFNKKIETERRLKMQMDVIFQMLNFET
jgi:hypothetical protein